MDSASPFVLRDFAQLCIAVLVQAETKELKFG